jgi:hypothetical protein
MYFGPIQTKSRYQKTGITDNCGMHARLQLIISATLLLIAVRVPANGADHLVRWIGQRPDDAPSRLPEGELLYPLPAGNYWGPAINCGARVTTHARAQVQEISFETDVELHEITLRVTGDGTVKVTRLLPEPTAGGLGYGTKASRQEPDEVVPLDSNDERWVRIRLKPETGKKWRLSFPEDLKCKRTLLWGKHGSQPLEQIFALPRKFSVAYETIPGGKKTTVTDHIYWSWQRPLIANTKMKSDGAVWAQHDKWARICSAPVLPAYDTLNKTVKVVMARNEHEGALLSLSSLRDEVGPPNHKSETYKQYVPGFQEFIVTTSDIRGPTPGKVKLTLRIVATMHSQLWGTVTGPLFASDNKLGTYQMLQYFTNGRMIADYPRIALQPCASQMFWLEVKTDGAAPGTYTATLNARPGPSLPIEIEVLPVMLPSPRTWVFSWCFGAVGTAWPFASADVLERTVSDKIARGISCFRGVPGAHNEPGEARRQKKDVYFLYHYLIPGYFVGSGYGGLANAFEDLLPNQELEIREHLTDVIDQFRQANVDYDDWSGELWYAPGDSGAPLIQKSAAWVKAIDPQVRVFVNPAFPEYLRNFQTMSAASDIFVPFWGNWFEGSQWRAEIKPGRINAFYAMQGSNRSELHEEVVGHRRILPWHAFKLGLQGWGFYSYYSPRGDPYTDDEPLDEEPDYAIVYPGPRGPVPSRQAEAIRDGWEDYRLLTLLAESKSPEAKQAIEEATAQIPMDREPLTAHVDFEAIRLKLLRVAAELSAERER